MGRVSTAGPWGKRSMERAKIGKAMATTHFETVDEYLAAQPEESRAALEKVRRAIRRAIPDAQELIAYQIPAYKIDGHAVLFFGGWKKHYSLYPTSDRIISDLELQLAQHEVHKGTIRFKLSEPVPVRLIARIARMRAAEVREREAARPR